MEFLSLRSIILVLEKSTRSEGLGNKQISKELVQGTILLVLAKPNQSEGLDNKHGKWNSSVSEEASYLFWKKTTISEEFGNKQVSKGLVSFKDVFPLPVLFNAVFLFIF